jgi:VIT1/CCC1 family predicted Fe2+/Mn2+ transporter
MKHNGNERAYIRDIILGINDGLISTTLITIGIYASGLTSNNIILSILSSSFAGSFSMGLGEYLATKSQKEVIDAELELEKDHIKYHINQELQQVRDFLKYTLLIKNNSLVEEFVLEMKKNQDGLFNFMKTVEFAVNDDDARSPIVAMTISGSLYFLGSAPSIMAFLFPFSKTRCFVLSCIFNAIALFSVGTLKTRITKTNLFISGFENLSIALIAGFLSYNIGFLFSQIIKEKT